MTYDEFKIALAKLSSDYENGLLTRDQLSAEITLLAMQFGENEW